LIVAFSGAIGNLLTILAVPWAQHKRILGFNRPQLKYTTIFIINLAFADFLYCVINLPLYSITYFTEGWMEDNLSCFVNAAFRYFDAFAAWMALGFVALSRCLSLCAPEVARVLSIKNRNLISIFMIWFYAFIVILPTMCGWYGTFGYDSTIGKCEFISTNPCLIHPKKVLMCIAFFSPLIIIIVSHFLIWRTCSTQNSAVLTSCPLRQNMDMRMTRTLIGLCLCYVIFVGPIVFVTLFPVPPIWNLVCYILYWMQYTTNFVLYAGRNPQYRKAYILYLRTSIPWLFTKKKERQKENIFNISSGKREVNSDPVISHQKDKKCIRLEWKLKYSCSFDLGMRRVEKN